MNLISEFTELRKVGTPWCVIRTPDYRAIIQQLKPLAENNVVWDCINGPIDLEESGIQLGTSDDPPFNVLKNALNTLPPNSNFFFIAPDNTLFENSFTIQGIANLRDAFKSTKRMLVILGVNPSLPPFLAEDIPVLDDPLPTEPEIAEIGTKLVTGLREKYPDLKVTDEEVVKASSICLGMTRFSAEQAFSRKIKKAGIDLAGLALTQKTVIEQSSGGTLVFEKERWTFDDIGGLLAFKDLMGRLQKGPKPFKLVVRVDEIDKVITAASTGQIADNTGASQDILRTFLTAMEDNGWTGLLAVGGPGTGKTLASICTGNQFGLRTFSCNPNASKVKELGGTEQNIKRMVDIIWTIGGPNVLFIATANRLDTMPSELIRRFRLGIWYWDIPNSDEKKVIWGLQRKRFSIPDADKLPTDEDWTGSDIKNCCEMAYLTQLPLKEAAEMISLAGKTSKSIIENLRDMAIKNDWRSANYKGAYKRPKQGTSRAVSLN